MNIKETALKAGHSTVPAYWLSDEKPIACSTSNFERLISFAEALVAELAKEYEWKPIETAPKDGTVFLGYKRGQFRECYKVPRDDCDMWCFGGTSGADDLFPNIKPTHWMPLPKPPVIAQGEQ